MSKREEPAYLPVARWPDDSVMWVSVPWLRAWVRRRLLEMAAGYMESEVARRIRAGELIVPEEEEEE